MITSADFTLGLRAQVRTICWQGVEYFVIPSARDFLSHMEWLGFPQAQLLSHCPQESTPSAAAFLFSSLEREENEGDKFTFFSAHEQQFYCDMAMDPLSLKGACLIYVDTLGFNSLD